MKTNEMTKPLDMNPVARALVPFQVQHLAAFRAYVCAHVNVIGRNGGPTAHRAKTAPVYERARAALMHAIVQLDADPCDGVDSASVAEEILRAESKARHAGRDWDALSAIEAWQASV